MHDLRTRLVALMATFTDELIQSVDLLAESGSSRKYYRLHTNNKTYIATLGSDVRENEAFVSFSNHFERAGIPVPKVYACSSDLSLYIQEDIGDVNLYQFLPTEGELHTDDLFGKYLSSIKVLVQLHTVGSTSFDFDACYPASAFDGQGVLWDLEYFKYFFLKLNDLVYDEYALQEELFLLRDKAMEIDQSCFMMRDFQSRNIMIKSGEPVLIDYQGGRRGPYQYDLVSLLWQAKANLPIKWKEDLYTFYVQELGKTVEIDHHRFEQGYWLFVLIRSMQVLGAYGLRGVVQRKEHFLKSIPYAINNLNYLFEFKSEFIPQIPAIESAFRQYLNKMKHEQ